MKKLLTIFTALIAISFLSVSCNKKLKENMDDLESSLDDQKSKNESLQSQVNTLNEALIRTPLKVNFTTTNDDDEAYSFSGEYKFAPGSDYFTSVMKENEGEGTYDITIIRTISTAVDGPINYASIEFTYNPSTSEVTDLEASCGGFNDRGQYASGNFEENIENNQTLTITAFDFNAGTITLNYSATTTADYPGNAFDDSMTLKLDYSGSLVKSYYDVLF